MKTSVIILLAVGAWSYSSAQDSVKSTRPARTAGSQMELTASHFLNKAAKMSNMEIEAGQLAQQKAQSAEVKAYGARMVKDHTEATSQLKVLATRKNISLSMTQESKPASGVSQNTVGTGTTQTGTTTTTATEQTSSTQATRDAQTSTGTTAANPTTAANANVNANVAGQYAAQADTGKHASHQEKLNQLRQSTGATFDREYMNMMVKDHTKAISLFEKGAQLDDADIKAFANQTLPILRDHLAAAERILSTLASANK